MKTDPMSCPLPAEALQSLILGIGSDFDTCAAPDVPDRVRSRLKSATTTPDLLLESSDLLLHQMRNTPAERFLVRDPHSRFTLQLFCWAPGFGNLPHLHANWTVSAVLAGSISVQRSAVSEADCCASPPLLASTGEVGMLRPPQYHCLKNPSSTEAAVTFHVFPLEDSYHQETAESNRPVRRIDSAGILALAKLAAIHGGQRSMNILRNAFEVAGNHTKLEVIKLLAKVDPQETVRLGTMLAHQVGGADGERLLNVLSRFERGTGGNELRQ